MRDLLMDYAMPTRITGSYILLKLAIMHVCVFIGCTEFIMLISLLIICIKKTQMDDAVIF